MNSNSEDRPTSHCGVVLVVDDEPSIRQLARRFLEEGSYQVREVDVISVLIVDDDARIRGLLVRWLAPDYETKEAPDAETALGLVAENVPDVVLVDVEMPGHGGLWLVEQLREQFPQVAVVLATAVSTIPPKVSMQGGVVEYLVKPFERERVMAAVGRAVEWRQTALARGPEQLTTRDPIAEWLDGTHAGRHKADGD